MNAFTNYLKKYYPKELSVKCVVNVKFTLLFTLLLSACSNISTLPTAKNQDNREIFTSDHQLLLSLLNRPLPEDQIMMMRFAKTINNTTQSPNVSYVEIRGSHNTNSVKAVTHLYSELIYNDQNSIAIRAPL